MFRSFTMKFREDEEKKKMESAKMDATSPAIAPRDGRYIRILPPLTKGGRAVLYRKHQLDFIRRMESGSCGVVDHAQDEALRLVITGRRLVCF